MSLITKTCVHPGCGKKFQCRTNNSLSLCPVHVAERKRAQDREACARYRAGVRAAREQRAELARAERLAEEAERARPGRKPAAVASGDLAAVGFGPSYGAASMGELYGANAGRLLGHRLDMDAMRLPVAVRPRNVLRREGR